MQQNTLVFTKMHGLGNDFVVCDLRNGVNNPPIDLIIKNIEKLCSRNFGIGCDQLVTIQDLKTKELGANMEVRFFNADGSEGEMCANAIRCVTGLIGRESLIVKTKGSVVSAMLDSKNKLVTVNMGTPSTRPETIPVNEPVAKMVLGSISEHFWFVNVGNPHCVLLGNWTHMPDSRINEIGSQIEHNLQAFPKRVNVEFATLISKTEVAVKVWERGSGRTLACGSGACATGFALISSGMCESNLKVFMDGSYHHSVTDTQPHSHLQISLRGKEIFMTGPYDFSFNGIIDLT